jgi:MFS transporter, PCFT/HCP family, solute carrier family 46 (folate transporter), member 1
MLISIGAVAGGISGPALSGLLMQKYSPWVPLVISGWVLLPIILITFIFLPETLPNWSSKRLAGIPSITKTDATSYFSAIRKHTYEAFGTLRSSLSMVRNRSMAMLLCTFLLQQPIERCLAQVLGQTLTKRFHWQLAQLGYFFSVRGLAAVLILALLPILANYMTTKNRKRPFSIFSKDMLLAQASFLSLITGLLLMSGENFPLLIIGQVVATLASGLASFEKALVVAYVKPEETSRLFALTGMLETVGALVGAPSMTWAFTQGVKMGGIWMGLPFWYAACLCAIAFTALCFVRRPPATTSEAAEGSDVTRDSDGLDNEQYRDAP